MTYEKFWSVKDLSACVDVEIEHFIPEDDEYFKKEELLEAYDIKLIVPNDWDYELDVPPQLAKKLYEKLKEIFE